MNFKSNMSLSKVNLTTIRRMCDGPIPPLKPAKFIPCTSCIHYNPSDNKCRFNYAIKDEKNYTLISVRPHILAVDARNNELYCGKDAKKFQYVDRNIKDYLFVGMLFVYPAGVTTMMLDSCIPIGIYISYMVYGYYRHEPTYNPNKDNQN